MADATFRVTPQEMKNTATSFSDSAAKVQTLTQKMTETVGNGLSSIWSGEAASAYRKKVDGIQDDINKMVRMIQEHSTDLKTMAENFIKAEESAKSEAEKLSVEIIE